MSANKLQHFFQPPPSSIYEHANDKTDLIYADLIKRSKLSVCAQTLNLFLLTNSFQFSIFQEKALWMSYIYLFVMLGVRLCMAFHLGPRSSQIGRRVFVVNTFGLASAWGLILFFVLEMNSESTTHTLAVLLASGLTSSAAYSFGSSRQDFMTYITTLVGCISVYFFKVWERSGNPGGFMMCLCFYCFVLVQGLSQHANWRVLVDRKLQLQALFDLFPGLVCLIRDDRFHLISRGLRHFTIQPMEYFLGTKVGEKSRNPEFAQRYYEFMKSAEKSMQCEMSTKSEFGDKTVLMLLEKVEASRDVILINLDITQYKLTEQELNTHRLQLASASKMVALGQMASGLAHEINNPLAVISARASHLASLLSKENLLQEEKLKSSLEIIQNTVQRIAKIIKGLRNFAREGSLESRQEVSLETIVQETLVYCESRFKSEQIKFIYNNYSKNVKVLGHSVQLSQVLLNILNNACDAMAKQDEKQIRLEICVNNSNAIITVEDSGPGVPEAYREDIMNPFFTTKEVGQGTGLGLSISKGIVEAHQGKLYFDFQRSRTTVVVEIPIHVAQKVRQVS